MNNTEPFDVYVIGAGLAGSEAAWAMAQAGKRVCLYEMRPEVATVAHHTGHCAELVCSNSFRSDDPINAIGCLKEEMRQLGSLTLAMAEEHRVPAGSGLAMDREAFAAGVTEALERHPNITMRRRELRSLLDIDVSWEASDAHTPVIIATGPLTAETLLQEIFAHTESEDLYFYDSMAPLIATDSIDESKTWRESRYGYGEGNEYINCPLTQDEYYAFIADVVAAPKVQPRNFEDPKYFEGCLPIEVMAERGPETLRFGPMKPNGLKNPHTGKEAFAVVQLRLDNKLGTIYNMVGFQTRMVWGAQREIFSRIPGLENAEFLRMGAMHRNTYINAPKLLNERLESKRFPHVRFAGQLIGVEGYVESAAMGLYAGLLTAGQVTGPPSIDSAMGSLVNHVAYGNPQRYEPMNANWGLTPALRRKVPSRQRKSAYCERARAAFRAWIPAALSPDNSVAIDEAIG